MTARDVVVTGGTGALGVAVVERLLDEGARCHVTWVVDDELERFALAARCVMHRVDCANEREVGDFYAALPGLDASVHLVGGFAMAPVLDTTLADFTRMFELNAATAFVCSREAVRRMRAGGRGGRIVNVAARPAVVPTGGMIAYATAKSAVAALTRALAEETRDEGVLVNAILPSTIDTPANRAAMPKADHARWAKPEEIACTIAFLAGPENALTTGTLVPVYGRG